MKAGRIGIKEIGQSSERFDPSYHLSEAVVIRKTIERSPYKRLQIRDVATKIFNGGRYRRIYVQNPEKGYKFLSSSDILASDLENVKMVSKKFMGGVEELKLQKGWTLITRSGTIGKTAFANAKHAH